MGTPTGKPITRIENPFVNVRAIEVYYGNLGAQFTSFPEWFPNLRSLTLYWAHIDPRCSVNMSFPHLEELDIELGPGIDRVAVQNFTTRLLRQCPQLQRLKLSKCKGEGINLQTMVNVIEGCQNIRNLKVYMEPRETQATMAAVQQLVNDFDSTATAWLRILNRCSQLADSVAQFIDTIPI